MGVERVSAPASGTLSRRPPPSISTSQPLFFLSLYRVPLTGKFAVPMQGVLEGMGDQEGMGELTMCSIHSGYWPVD